MVSSSTHHPVWHVPTVASPDTVLPRGGPLYSERDMALNNPRLGKVLLSLREKANMPQRDASALLGITINHLSLIEQGHRGPSLEMLANMAGLYGVSMSSLFKQYEGGR